MTDLVETSLRFKFSFRFDCMLGFNHRLLRRLVNNLANPEQHYANRTSGCRRNLDAVNNQMRELASDHLSEGRDWRWTSSVESIVRVWSDPNCEYRRQAFWVAEALIEFYDDNPRLRPPRQYPRRLPRRRRRGQPQPRSALGRSWIVRFLNHPDPDNVVPFNGPTPSGFQRPN